MERNGERKSPTVPTPKRMTESLFESTVINEGIFSEPDILFRIVIARPSMMRFPVEALVKESRWWKPVAYPLFNSFSQNPGTSSEISLINAFQPILPNTCPNPEGLSMEVFKFSFVGYTT